MTKQQAKLKVYPAVNGETFEEISEKIGRVRPYVERVHVDVADGTFTGNTLWHNPQDLLSLDPELKVGVHLMIGEIDRRVEDWFLPNIESILFHLSASKDPDLVINKCKEAGKKVGISISPSETVKDAVVFKDKVDFFQVLCVNPGLAGQGMIDESVDKVSRLRELCDSCIIEVDGGVNIETVKKVHDAGANIVVAASAIFDKDDTKKAIEDLKNSI